MPRQSRCRQRRVRCESRRQPEKSRRCLCYWGWHTTLSGSDVLTCTRLRELRLAERPCHNSQGPGCRRVSYVGDCLRSSMNEGRFGGTTWTSGAGCLRALSCETSPQPIAIMQRHINPQREKAHNRDFGNWTTTILHPMSVYPKIGIGVPSHITSGRSSVSRT